MTTDAHASPIDDAPEPLYDINVPTPTYAERARTLVAQIKTGTLCTLTNEPDGYPYGSFVTVAFDDGNPVFLVSTLAEHTRNLQRDARASLLVAEDSAEDPLSNGRVTLLGSCKQVVHNVDSARNAFLASHPNASYYVDFNDFSFWKLTVESIRYIGGYGRMSWIEATDWRTAEPDPLAVDAGNIISHMNTDHPEALALYCKAFSKATDIDTASMTSIDRYGFELSAMTTKGPRPIRLGFTVPVHTPEEARTALITMLNEARDKLF